MQERQIKETEESVDRAKESLRKSLNRRQRRALEQGRRDPLTNDKPLRGRGNTRGRPNERRR